MISSWRNREVCLRRDHRALLRSAIDSHNNFAAELAPSVTSGAELLCRNWSARRYQRDLDLEANKLVTELAAVASTMLRTLLRVAKWLARVGKLRTGPRLAVFGLGRLGTGGVDYGSDLDILIT